MKKGFLLFGLIFALGVSVSHAQIFQFYSQDFEAGSTVNYQLANTTTGAPQTTIVSGGSRSMKLTHTQNEMVIMTLDTIDFSSNASLNYYVLDFMHIAFVNPSDNITNATVCYLEAKRPDEPNWNRLNSTYYNMTDGAVSTSPRSARSTFTPIRIGNRRRRYPTRCGSVNVSIWNSGSRVLHLQTGS